jgi:hypothetical protein
MEVKEPSAKYLARRGYKQTEVGLIPEDWDFKSLGAIACIATGNTPPTNDATNYGDDFLFVSPVDLGYAKYILQTDKMLSKKGFATNQCDIPVVSILDRLYLLFGICCRVQDQGSCWGAGCSDC